jgi:hypothetical protein
MSGCAVAATPEGSSTSTVAPASVHVPVTDACELVSTSEAEAIVGTPLVMATPIPGIELSCDFFTRTSGSPAGISVILGPPDQIALIRGLCPDWTAIPGVGDQAWACKEFAAVYAVKAGQVVGIIDASPSPSRLGYLPAMKALLQVAAGRM